MNEGSGIASGRQAPSGKSRPPIRDVKGGGKFRAIEVLQRPWSNGGCLTKLKRGTAQPSRKNSLPAAKEVRKIDGRKAKIEGCSKRPI